MVKIPHDTACSVIYKILIVKVTITMVKTSQPSLSADPAAKTVMTAIRSLYAATDRFDAYAAVALGVDRSAVRAINAMENGPVSPSDLITALGLTSGAVTSLIHRLQTAGHVSVAGSAADGRRRQVHLTPGGRLKAEKLLGRLGQVLAAELAVMDPKELKVMARCLPLLASAFDQAVSEDF
jgi:DNA-binding MarR family transcriptional regulator